MAVDCLDEKGQSDRDAVVIFGRDQDGGTGRRSYALLEANANRFANHLRGLGVEPGDRIALYLENRPEYLEAMLGAYKVRAVPINVNFRYVAGELRRPVHPLHRGHHRRAEGRGLEAGGRLLRLPRGR